MPPFHLQLFGTLQLSGPLASADVMREVGPRRRHALLAVVATSGERGSSRDRLLPLFWPDVPQQRARHSLEQLLYTLRSTVDDTLLLGPNPLRLNPAVIDSDVARFELALRRQDDASAVAEYRGDFLDGFFLSDAVEFERWVDGERARFHRLHLDALARLAAAAAASGDAIAAVRLWRRFADSDPLSTSGAVGLIRALLTAGDPASALRHADWYEAHISRELGASVGPEVAALVAELRRPTAPRDRTAPPAVPSREMAGARRTPPDPAITAAPSVRVADRPARWRRFVLPTVAIATLLAGALAVQYGNTARRRTAELDRSIVVLPLANPGGDPADGRLADGLTEELTAMIGRGTTARVIASTSAFTFRDQQLDVRRIADSLRVGLAVEGAFQRLGERIRVSIRLVNARDGLSLWSQTYDRDITDLFHVQEEIARSVARALNARLPAGAAPGAPQRRYEPTPAAYEWYLRGSDPGLLRSDSGRRLGLALFTKAIAADSGFPAAHAGLAHMHISLGLSSARGDHRELFRQAELAARKAVALDDTSAEAHLALGSAHLVVQRFAEAESSLVRARALDPRVPRIWEFLVVLYAWTDRRADALDAARHARELDPLSSAVTRELGRALLLNRRYDEALAELARIRAVSPPVAVRGLLAGQAYLGKKMWGAAQTEFESAARIGSPLSTAYVAHALARAGRTAEARHILDSLERERPARWALGAAIIHAGLGDVPTSLQRLHQAVDDRALSVDVMGPALDDVRRDPRFREIKHKLGLR